MAIDAAMLREDRLVFWDRLLRGERVDPVECRELMTRLAHEAPPEEKSGCILLVASVCLAREGNRAMQRNLRAALRYWFSHSGTKERPETFDPCELQDGGLETVVGLYLSWPEAMLSVGGNPDDYTAMKRLERRLRAKCVEEWERQFNTPAPDEIRGRR